jgi:hypothetical protein
VHARASLADPLARLIFLQRILHVGIANRPESSTV